MNDERTVATIITQNETYAADLEDGGLDDVLLLDLGQRVVCERD